MLDRNRVGEWRVKKVNRKITNKNNKKQIINIWVLDGQTKKESLEKRERKIKERLSQRKSSKKIKVCKEPLFARFFVLFFEDVSVIIKNRNINNKAKIGTRKKSAFVPLEGLSSLLIVYLLGLFIDVFLLVWLLSFRLFKVFL